MTKYTEGGTGGLVPANDNGNALRDADIEPWEKRDRVVLSIARLIGRQIAREHFEALRAANDNTTLGRDTADDENP